MKKILVLFTALCVGAAAFTTTAFSITSKYKSDFKRSIQNLITTANVSAEAQILSNASKTDGNSAVNEYKSESKTINGFEQSTTNANINYKYLLKQLSSTKMKDFLPQSDWVKTLNSDSGWDDTLTMENQLVKTFGKTWDNEQNSPMTTSDVSFSSGSKTGSSSIASNFSTISSLLSILFGSNFNIGQASLLYQNTGLIYNVLPSQIAGQNTGDFIDNIINKLNILPTSDQVQKYFINPFTTSVEKENGEIETITKTTSVYNVMNDVGVKFWRQLFFKDAINLNDFRANIGAVSEEEALNKIKTRMQAQFGITDDNSYSVDFSEAIDQTSGKLIVGKIITISSKDSAVFKNKASLTVEENPEDNEAELDVSDNETFKKITSIVNYAFMIIWYIQQFDTSKTVTSDDIANVLKRNVTEEDVKNYDQINIKKVTEIFNNFLKPGKGYIGARGLINALLAIPTTDSSASFNPISNVLLSPVFYLIDKSKMTVINQVEDEYLNSTYEVNNKYYIKLVISNYLKGQLPRVKSSNENIVEASINSNGSDVNNPYLIELNIKGVGQSLITVSYDGADDMQFVIKTSASKNSSSLLRSYSSLLSTSNVKTTSITNLSITDNLGSIFSKLSEVNFGKLIEDVIEWINTPNSIPLNLKNSLIKAFNFIKDNIKEISFDKDKLYSIVEKLINDWIFKSLTDNNANVTLAGDVLYVLALYKNQSLSAENKIDKTGFSYISAISGVKNDLFYSLYDGKFFKSLFQLVNSFTKEIKSSSISNLNIKVFAAGENKTDVETRIRKSMEESFSSDVKIGRDYQIVFPKGSLNSEDSLVVGSTVNVESVSTSEILSGSKEIPIKFDLEKLNSNEVVLGSGKVTTEKSAFNKKFNEYLNLPDSTLKLSTTSTSDDDYEIISTVNGENGIKIQQENAKDNEGNDIIQDGKVVPIDVPYYIENKSYYLKAKSDSKYLMNSSGIFKIGKSSASTQSINSKNNVEIKNSSINKEDVENIELPFGTNENDERIAILQYILRIYPDLKDSGLKVKILEENENQKRAQIILGEQEPIEINYSVKQKQDVIIDPSIINIIPDLKSILDIKLGDLFTVILGLSYDDDLQFLYGLKDKKFVDIFEAVNNYFKPKSGSVIGDEGYFFDIGSIRDIASSFLKEQTITIGGEEFKNISNLKAVLLSLKAGLNKEDVEFSIDGEKKIVSSEKAIVVALGIYPDGKSFIDNSIFGEISKAYGNKTIVNPEDGSLSNDPKKSENTIKVISGISELASWFQNKSEAEYIKDNFSEFLNQKNWVTEFISETNYEDIKQDAEIKYWLTYNNTKYKIKEKYEVTLIRKKIKGNTQYGSNSFKISNITRK